MRYRVVTQASVRRTYEVEAINEKAALNASVFMAADDEDDIAEEILSISEVPADQQGESR